MLYIDVNNFVNQLSRSIRSVLMVTPTVRMRPVSATWIEIIISIVIIWMPSSVIRRFLPTNFFALDSSDSLADSELVNSSSFIHFFVNHDSIKMTNFPELFFHTLTRSEVESHFRE